MPTTTWDNLPLEKRARIIDAASAEFGARGFSLGSMNTIARTADVAKGSLFQYFEDKLDLIVFVQEQANTAARDLLVSSLVQPVDDGQRLFDVLPTALVGYIEHHRRNPVDGQLLRAMTFECDPNIRSTVRHNNDRQWVHVLSRTLDRAAERGELRDGTSITTLAHMLHGLFQQLGVGAIVPELNLFVLVHRLQGPDLLEAMREFVGPLEAYHGGVDHLTSS